MSTRKKFYLIFYQCNLNASEQKQLNYGFKNNLDVGSILVLSTNINLHKNKYILISFCHVRWNKRPLTMLTEKGENKFSC